MLDVAEAFTAMDTSHVNFVSQHHSHGQKSGDISGSTIRNLTRILVRILLGELLVLLTFIELFTNEGSGTGIQGMFASQVSRHSHSLPLIYEPRAHTNAFQSSFVPSTVWNHLPHEALTAHSINSFKSLVAPLFL